MLIHNNPRYPLTLLAVLFLPVLTFAQEKGLDQKIDKAFAPIANVWESIVTFGFPIIGVRMPLVAILLVLGALFFTVYFGFINIRRFPLAIWAVIGKYDYIERRNDPMTDNNKVIEGKNGETISIIGASGEVSHFQALATAISGTVGLGNVAGVAVAIAIGGPGATFWMIICGLLGMSTKFVECTLGVKYRDIDSNGTVYGGPMYYLSKGLAERGLTRLGRVFGIIFATLCVGASFGGGNAFQANQATVQITSMFGLEGGAINTVIGLVIAVLVLCHI
ncbi:MAG: alanine:cation symporter family protein [Zavarzinella sp.]